MDDTKVNELKEKGEALKAQLETSFEENKKYGKFALTFGIWVFFILASFFLIQNTLIVRSVRSSTQGDYSSFGAKIVEEDASKIGFWTETLLNDLRYYSESDVTKLGDQETIIRWLHAHTSFRNKAFDYVVFCTPEGVGYLDTGSTITTISKKFYTAIATDKKESYVSNIEFLSDGRVCFYISRPAYDKKGNFVGVFAGAVQLDDIENMIDDLVVGAGGKIILAGSDGVLIGHMRGEEKYIDLNYSDKIGYKGLTNLKEDLKNQITNEGYYTDKQGITNFITYHPVPGTPWTTILSIPESQIHNASNNLSRYIALISVVICILIVSASTILILRMMKPLKVVRDSIADIATGDADLTRKVEVKSNNEIGELGAGFNRFMEKLRTIIGGVKDSKEIMESVKTSLNQRIQDNGLCTEDILGDLQAMDNQIQSQSNSVSQTAASVEQVSKNIESLESMIETQSSAVTEASAAVEEMIGNIRSVNVSVGHMATSFDTLSKKADEGITIQDDVNKRILTIEEQSKTLQDANKVISSIASQTNLLAMNAAIEAAHAGEAGRGFSVVAEEIRKLSENSSSQSKKIREELNNIQNSIGNVVQASQASSDSFAHVSSSIQETEQLVLQIKAAMEEQETGSQQIGDALKLMNDNTSQVRAASMEMGEGNKAILVEINDLKETTGMIRESMSEIRNSADQIKHTIESLNEISESVESTVTQIGEQIDLFTV